MRTEVVTVAATTPLSEVARLLTDHRIGGAPVTDEAGHLIGVVSLRDLLERYAQDPDARPRHGYFELAADEVEGQDGEQFEVPEDSEDTAGDVMTAQVHTVPHNAPLPDVARRMVDLQVHRVLVTEGRHHVGLVSTLDVMRALAKFSAAKATRH